SFTFCPSIIPVMGADPLLQNWELSTHIAYTLDPFTFLPLRDRKPPCKPPRNEPSEGAAMANFQFPASGDGGSPLCELGEVLAHPTRNSRQPSENRVHDLLKQTLAMRRLLAENNGLATRRVGFRGLEVGDICEPMMGRND